MTPCYSYIISLSMLSQYCQTENSKIQYMKELLQSTLHQTSTISEGKVQLRAFEQLGIDHKGPEDLKEIDFILKQLLKYPSSQLAQIHAQAHRLGNNDLSDDHPEKFTLEELAEIGHGIKFCTCCGFLQQKNQLKICTKIDDICNLGISTYLYFQTLITVTFMFIVMFLIYSIFSIITNINASQGLGQRLPMLSEIALKMSLGQKHLNHTYENMNIFAIQNWLGVATIILWGFVFVYAKGKQKKKIKNIRDNDGELIVEQEAISAADFSILMENVPKSINQEKMQTYFDEYKKMLVHLFQGHQSIQQLDFTIAKFNVGQPFYLHQEKFDDEELAEINKNYYEHIKQYAAWIMEKKKGDFSKSKLSRQQSYFQFRQIEEKRLNAYKIITEKVLEEFQETKNREPTNTVFITFTNTQAKKMILSLNDLEWRVVLRQTFLFCRSSNRMMVEDADGKQVPTKIVPAPEPQDIIWVNLGHSFGERNKRKLVTSLATILILAASFGVVYGLSLWQQNALKEKNNTLSIGISLILSIFNLLIQMVIRILTIYQRDYSETSHQTSLAIKSVLALLINSIAIPIIINVVIFNDLYDENGLIADVFLLGITNSLLSPFLKIFDFYYLGTRLMKKWYNRPSKKLFLNQNQLNEYYEGIPFEAGYEYIYIINLYLFTCFFVPLEPVLPLFSILGLFLMYWAQKFSIFNYCKRPVPGNNTIHIIMFQFVYLGPLFYTLGNYVWKSYFPEELNALIRSSGITALVFSLFILFLPYDVLFQFIYKDSQIPSKMDYYEKRIYLPSEYDRLNPATSREALKQYSEFVADFKKKLNKKNPKEIKKIQQGFFKQITRGIQQNNHMLPNRGNGDIENLNKNIVEEIFSSKSNFLSPILIGGAIMPHNQHITNRLSLGQNQNENIDLNELLLNRISSKVEDDEEEDKKRGLNIIGRLIKRNKSLGDTDYPNILEPANKFQQIFKLASPRKKD